jgi:hypothetical protein
MKQPEYFRLLALIVIPMGLSNINAKLGNLSQGGEKGTMKLYGT